jgi:hypothetical protein
VAQILGLVVLLTGSEALAWLLPLGGLGGLVGFVLYDVPPYKRECCRVGAK